MNKVCPGCYRPNADGYCTACRKALFDGAKVSPILDFDPPKADNLPQYQEKTKRLSISGVQLKYSLRLDGKQLALTESGGQYIIKPIPPTPLLTHANQAPENEHLTMQIASQVFGIKTAANGLIYFKDGTPAYLTRRFDIKQDGTKFLQEDMAQLSGANRQTRGENFKYMGTYEDIGQLIDQHVAAAVPAMESFFRILLFNYIFSNGDAHLKNFSVIQTMMGDFSLTPAYDLMATILHTPHENDTALDLYKGDMEDPFYESYGYYGQQAFRILGRKLGLHRNRADRIITQLLMAREEVNNMIRMSFLEEDIKNKYLKAYIDKLKRFGMTQEMISSRINPKFPGVYGTTTNVVSLTLRTGKLIVGYFEPRLNHDVLEKDNRYTFIETKNAQAFTKTRDEQLITIVNGDDILQLDYTAK